MPTKPVAAKWTPIDCCAFCGDDAVGKAADGTPVCENCYYAYKPNGAKR